MASRKSSKLERCQSLGLTYGIVASEGTFAAQVSELTLGRLCDVVLDTVGAKYLAENLKALAPRGHMVVIGLLGGIQGDLPLGLLVSKRARFRVPTPLSSGPSWKSNSTASAFCISSARVPEAPKCCMKKRRSSSSHRSRRWANNSREKSRATNSNCSSAPHGSKDA